METKGLVIQGLNLDDEDLGSLLNTRSYAQYVEMVSWFTDGCKFCNLDRVKNKIVWTSGNWRMWVNPYPLKHTHHHLVLAPESHLTHTKDMSVRDWGNFSKLVAYATGALYGGALVMRFGDPHLNAGSVRHLHANIIVPNNAGEVRIPLAKNPEDIENKKKIVRVFERIRRCGIVTGLPLTEVVLLLNQEDQALVKDRLG